MKKYVKPVLYFESFELSQNISTCGFDMNTTEGLHCVAKSDDAFWPDHFILYRDWCKDSIDGEWGDMICYQPSSETWGDAYRIFNS